MNLKTIQKGALLLCLATSFCFSQKILNVGFSPIWPSETKSTAWNIFAELGYIFDEKVGVGGKIDFLWNIDESTLSVKDSLNTSDILLEKDGIFMFPLSAFLSFDPVPQYVVHPVFQAQFGFNMMVRDYAKYDSSGVKVIFSKERNPDGFYIGALGKVSINAVYDVGKQAAFFFGYEHQIGKLSRRVKNNLSHSYPVYAPALRLGVSVLM